MVKVSIVVPCYNQAQYLSETLDSVLAQTYTDWECIIVNDGSIDDTYSVASRYVETDERFKYLYQENQGVSAARNNGIAIANGYFVLPLDGDDLIEPTYIEKAVAYFEKNPETKLVYSEVNLFGAKNCSCKMPEYKYESLIWKNSIVCTALYRRADFYKTQGYSIDMKKGLEDWDFWLSLLDENSVVHMIDEVLFHYRIKSVSRNVGAVEYGKELRRQIFNNHKDIYEKYMPDLINFYNECSSLRDDNIALRNSSSYRLGKFLLAPFIALKNKLKK